MKLVKSSLSIALCSVIALPTFAADVEFYGKANVTLQNSNNGNGEGSFNEIVSNASRLGAKGSHALSEDLSIIYKAEFQIDMASGEKSGGSIDDRNQYIGLKGNFGEIVVGNNDTVLKQSQGKVDLFNDYEGDIKRLFEGDNRADQGVTYKTPKFSGFQGGLTYLTEASNDAKNGDEAAYGVSVTYGDPGLKKSVVYAGLAYDDGIDNYNVVRGTVQGKIAGFVIGGMLQREEKVDGTREVDGYLLSGKYTIDAITLKAQYQAAQVKDGKDNTGYSVGADYKLSKAAKLTAFYTTFDLQDAQIQFDEKQKYLAVGMEFKF